MQQAHKIETDNFSSNVSEASCNSLETIDDIINDVRKNFKNITRRARVLNCSFVESYIEGDTYIIFDRCITFRGIKYDLIFTAVKSWPINLFCGPIRKGVNHFNISNRGDWGNQPMLIFNAYPVQCPNITVWSFVWLDLSQERDNILGISRTFGADKILQPADIVGDREIGSLISRKSIRSIRKCIPSVVESGPQIINSIGGDCSKIIRNRFSKFYRNFLRFMNSVEIILTDNSAGFLQKGTYPFIKVGNVIITPRKTEFCTME